ncbi:uncharacterized protein LOC115630502 [Scaptodrosophila lebanonensis]|uniref:Uncharacterized protein LOC115630502 n=1 Tax=Drosophila lebanonensis TaxID=7225 RepID=A0A6J2U3G6_DROLE|nr:uncharacterized protein LOC115630502 [Scaptodrosophila lebanonensis]
MSSASLLDALCNGSGARLALGSSVIAYLIVYNEASAPTLLFATLLATVYGAMAARCKSSLRSLQIPYVRATNKFDFGCLFMAMWLDALAGMCACAALARTLSACLDAMTGGLARILILGRNSPVNEPWPDVLGVAVVFLVTGMFMLGLEHSKAFSLIMTLGMFGLNAILSAVGWWRGDFLTWTQQYFQPNGINSFFLATALLTYAFPSDFPTQQRSGLLRFTGTITIGLVSTSLLLTAICLSTVVHYKTNEDYVAVPLFNILDESGFHKLVPASACMLLLTSSAAFLELFPGLYGIVVRFATSEWRILSKQISYESSDSGNPVLAVFIGGSLCAMLAFACPLQHLSYTLAASHMTSVFLRAFYLLYTPYRPKYIQPSSSDSSLSYSRLSTAPITKSSSSNMSSSSRLKRSLWNISLPKQGALKKPKSKTKNKQEVEKEWLLLGEPTSPCPQRETRDVESTILSDGEPPPSDFEYPDKFDKSDSDTSTDIDAIVDEYRQKIKVTTAGPMERSLRVPTISSWRVTMFAIIVMGLGIALSVAGLVLRWAPAALTGAIGVLVVAIMMGFIPKYTGSSVINVSPVLCSMCLLLGVVLFSACAVHSWPGVLFWLLAGLIMLIRCDRYCCNCFEHTTTYNEQLIPSVSAKATPAATAGSSTSIRMPRPPKGVVGLPQRVNGNR